MDDDYSEYNNDLVGSERINSNNLKNQNSSLDQSSTEANNTNGLQNKNLKFDEIPIKPAANNFLELLEKNLENAENIDDDNDYTEDFQPKKRIKYEPRKKRDIKFDFSKQKKYKYYSQKFDKDFGKDIDKLDQFETYNEISNKNKPSTKYDKMKNNSSNNSTNNRGQVRKDHTNYNTDNNRNTSIFF